MELETLTGNPYCLRYRGWSRLVIGKGSSVGGSHTLCRQELRLRLERTRGM